MTPSDAVRRTVEDPRVVSVVPDQVVLDFQP